MFNSTIVYLFSLLVACFLACPTNAVAQQANDDNKDMVKSYLEVAGDHAALYRGRMLGQSYIGWNSHPYWGDGQFMEGSVRFRGIVYPHVLLRYNLFEQLLEVQTPDRKLVVQPDQKQIEHFEMDGRHFEPRENGFAAIDYAGRDFTLETRYRKFRVKDDLDAKYAQKVMAQKHKYFIHSAEGEAEVSSYKSLRKLFPAYRKELDRLKSEQKLSFKSEARQQSLVACAKRVDELSLVQQSPLQPRYGKAMLTDGLADSAEPTKSRKARNKAANEAMAEAGNDSVKRFGTVVLTALPDSLLQLAVQDMTQVSATYDAFTEGAPAVVKKAEERALARSNGGFSDLKPATESRTLNEIEVTAFRSNVGLVQMGAEKFRPQQLKNVPMALGEADIMKMVQTMPGVKTMGEVSSGFNVRGGAADQNLILLGGGTIYNPMHMFGLFSAFNTDALNDVELFKGSVPAQYGGRLSSVMNVTGKIADKKHVKGSVSLGALTSKAHLEVPIVKDKLSWMVAGRTTYSDWMTNLISGKSEYAGGKAGFYDITSSLSWTINKNHFLNAYGYYSHDRFSFNVHETHKYANTLASVEWKSYWNDVLSSQVTAGYDHYDYQDNDRNSNYTAGQLAFIINDMYLRAHAQWLLGDRHTLRFGLNNLLYDLMPGASTPFGIDSSVRPIQLPNETAYEGTIYAEDEYEATDQLTLQAGARMNAFLNTMAEKGKGYARPELRFSSVYKLNSNHSLKLGVNTMTQFIHKVSNTIIMAPNDTWVLSNRYIKPQQGWQASAGYSGRTNNGVLEMSAEVYYKQMRNYLTYRGGATLTMNPQLENDVLPAQGNAYGIELQLKKLTGKLNGWISYSYSRTFLRQQDHTAPMAINGGAWYPAEYDRPHELNVVANYKFTRRYSMSLNADYASGRPTTIPEGQFYDTRLECYVPYYTDRNGYRMPDNFRIDLSFNIEPGHHLTSKTHHWLSFGVYNLLGRKNIYNVYYKIYDHVPQGYALSIFGCQVPFISYNIKF